MEEQFKQDHYYHCSFIFREEVIQMWIHSTENKICFYQKSTGACFVFDDTDTNVLARLLQTASNTFYSRMIEERRVKKLEKLAAEEIEND